MTEQVTGCLVTIVGTDLNKTLKSTALRIFWLKWSIHTRTEKAVFTRRLVSFHILVQLRSDTTHFQLFETRPPKLYTLERQKFSSSFTFRRGNLPVAMVTNKAFVPCLSKV